MAENTNKLGDFARTTLDSIKSMLDANTVVGDPIVTSAGVTIIPISKITVGYASGGLDYAKKNAEVKPNNFGGGGGTGVSVVPVAMLIIGEDGKAQVLNVNSGATQANTADTVTQVVNFLERSPELIERVRDAFSKKKDSNVDFGE